MQTIKAWAGWLMDWTICQIVSRLSPCANHSPIVVEDEPEGGEFGCRYQLQKCRRCRMIRHVFASDDGGWDDII